MNKTFTISTLGCKLNFSESSQMARQLKDIGYDQNDGNGNAELVVVNTCTVTELANKKSKQVIRKLIKQNPNAKVVAVGCYSQLKPKEVSLIDGVDLVLGANNKSEIANWVQKLENDELDEPIHSEGGDAFEPSYSFGDRTRSFFKIQDGCDYYCSYCTIPLARGRSRNNNIESTVNVANEIVSKGVKEIILTGVNIGDFGKSTDESFFQLLKELVKVEGLERLRISSIEPNLLNEEIIELAAESNVIMPHFHIPLQCGTDNLLRLMRRRYTTALFEKRVKKIKSLMPDACIAADVIVGVPGETQEEFAAACDFIKGIDVTNLHVFTYSERENTLAVKMDNQVPLNIRKERSKVMHEIARNKQAIFSEKCLSNVYQVLFEGDYNEEFMFGFTDNYIRVRVPLQKDLVNHICSVKLLSLVDYSLVVGEII